MFKDLSSQSASAMAESCAFEDTLPQEENDFQSMLAQIGGRERIHLVSDIGESKENDDAMVLQEFLRDVFNQSSFTNSQTRLPGNCGDVDNEKLTSCKTGSATEFPLTERSGEVTGPVQGVVREKQDANDQKTVTRRNIYSSKRTIDCPVIIFIFRTTFLSCHANLVCLKEILKDVKARTKRAKFALPALIGLTHTSLESAESKQCTLLLETMMRTVFHRHAPGDMWIGSFIPEKEDNILEIKRNFCRVILSSRTADNTRHRGNPLLWPFQCFLGPNGRLARSQANGNSTDNWQAGKKDLEECIPLRTNNQPICRPAVDEDSPVKDG